MPEPISEPRLKHWIDGDWYSGTPDGWHTVRDPATGSFAANVPVAGLDDIEVAVRAAGAAAKRWSRTPIGQRTEILFEFRAALLAARDELSCLVAQEQGKTRTDAMGEFARALEIVEFACGIGSLMKGERVEEVSTGVDVFSARHALGVVLGISPFNFPLLAPIACYVIAVACGNSVVLKPSERAPSAVLRQAELFADAGLPAGVLNVVLGDGRSAERLVAHPGIHGITFVGSTPVARSVYERGTATGKRVQAFGSAKNHMVVLPDAPIDDAADAATAGAFGAAGQRCMAVSVVVAVGDSGDALVAAITDRMAGIKVGPGMADPPSDIGPLISASAREGITAHLEKAVLDGARLVVDGRGIDVPGCADGFYLGPCLVDYVSPEMSIYRDELFGPVLSVVRVPTYEDALELVNTHRYANGVAIFTSNGGAARAFERDADVGMVGVNVPVPVPVGYFSFGGWRMSLFGDHDMYGPDAVRFYTRQKTVTSRWPGGAVSRSTLDFPTNK